VLLKEFDRFVLTFIETNQQVDKSLDKKALPPTWVCGKWGLTEVIEH
jgi:hypothetical protein